MDDCQLLSKHFFGNEIKWFRDEFNLLVGMIRKYQYKKFKLVLREALQFYRQHQKRVPDYD